MILELGALLEMEDVFAHQVGVNNGKDWLNLLVS
jgi:hypothetical protein